MIDSLESGPEGFFVKQISPAYPMLLEYCVDPNTRKKIWMKTQEEDYNGNSALFKETVVLRHERAVLLGFANQATYQLRNNMVANPDAARRLLAKFRERIARLGVLDFLKETKRNDPAANDEEFQFWDEAYYERIRTETTYSIDETKISEYFPLQSTVRGMFDLFEALFGIVVEKVDAKLWHEDAELYSIWDDEDSGGNFSGYIYLDLVKRPGKFAGGCNFGQHPGYISRSGERRYAVNALVCNFFPPTPTKPCLLKHNDVTSLFHELGHSMHAVLSRSTYGRYSGTMNMFDFGKVPSLLLENWCWVPEVLQKLSRHYKTDEKMPDDLTQSIVSSALVAKAMLKPFQVIFATFDLTVFTPASQEAAEEMDLAEIWYDLFSKISGIEGPENCPRGYRFARARHSVCNYPGSVTLYISGFCFAELIWKSLFEKDPMSSDAGMRWRREVLEKGGTMMPLDMLEGLFGKRPDVEDLCN